MKTITLAILAGFLIPISFVRAASPPGLDALNAPVITSVSGAYAYPVPFKPSKGDVTVKFDNLAADSTITVYTIMGELVTRLHNDNNEKTKIWPVTNSDGDSVASGVYIYEIKSVGGEKRGKLVIVR